MAQLVAIWKSSSGVPKIYVGRFCTLALDRVQWAAPPDHALYCSGQWAAAPGSYTVTTGAPDQALCCCSSVSGSSRLLNSHYRSTRPDAVLLWSVGGTSRLLYSHNRTTRPGQALCYPDHWAARPNSRTTQLQRPIMRCAALPSG